MPFWNRKTPGEIQFLQPIVGSIKHRDSFSVTPGFNRVVK